MKRTCLAPVLLAGALLFLPGCLSNGESSLFQLPRTPEDLNNLMSKIREVTGQGGEQTAPLSGENIQNVQLQDLDGDGVKEAIAFFRMNGDEKPLKIYIYSQNDEEYQVQTVIEGTGTAINYVAYQDLNGDGSRELVVSWQISTQVHELAAYTVHQRQAIELMSVTDYTDFTICDLDEDDAQEILVFRLEPEGNGSADFYDFQDGIMALQSEAPTSAGIKSISSGGIQNSRLLEDVPAVFVTYDYGTDGNVSITDIFAWKEGGVRNVTLNEQMSSSSDTVLFNTSVGPTDIDRDGIMELPQMVEVKEYKQTSTASNFWLIRWRKFDLDGASHLLYTTYYNDRDGWYLELPERWVGKITLSRSDTAGGGERAVIFSYWERDNDVEPVPFLTICRLTGSSRQSRAEINDRFRLADSGGSNPSTVYVAQFTDGGWDCGLDEEDVAARFHLIESDWY